MPIFKRNNTWYIDIRKPSGQRIRCSARTTDKKAAQELHDKLKHDFWREERLGERPKVLWDTACLHWLDAKATKKTIAEDELKMTKLTAFRGVYLHHMTKDFILNEINKVTPSPSSRNHYIALVQAILNKCVKDWDFLETAPKLPRYTEPKRRVRWLTKDEAQRLLAVLPDYLKQAVLFSLSTGLRKHNVLYLRWSQVDMERKVAWIHHDEFKSGHSLGVALNETAMNVLKYQQGKHDEFVFTNSLNRPLRTIDRIWQKALVEAGIKNFRWHDLRHTWASWLVQSGVPLVALQEMGGWQDIRMIYKYAHLAPEHLHHHASLLDKALDTDLAHNQNEISLYIDFKE